jgi:hypothetical protein
MDPVIFMGARMPHLTYESLPPLADYDRAEHLVATSEQVRPISELVTVS